MAVPMFKERLNNMASQIHLFISDHHTTSANTFPPDLFQGMLSPFSWLPMFKNRDVMLVFPIPIYPKISIQSPVPNTCATSVSVKHILSALSDVLSHHHMPPSSFSTLITAPAPILQSFLQLLPCPMKPQFQPGSTSTCYLKGPFHYPTQIPLLRDPYIPGPLTSL